MDSADRILDPTKKGLRIVGVPPTPEPPTPEPPTPEPPTPEPPTPEPPTPLLDAPPAPPAPPTPEPPAPLELLDPLDPLEAADELVDSPPGDAVSSPLHAGKIAAVTSTISDE